MTNSTKTIVDRLRSVNSSQAPYANDLVRKWCYEAADEISEVVELLEKINTTITIHGKVDRGTHLHLAIQDKLYELTAE